MLFVPMFMYITLIKYNKFCCFAEVGYCYKQYKCNVAGNTATLRVEQTCPAEETCADPEIFMSGGPTKMVIFGHRRGGGGGGVPQNKIPKLPFFR